MRDKLHLIRSFCDNLLPLRPGRCVARAPKGAYLRRAQDIILRRYYFDPTAPSNRSWMLDGTLCNVIPVRAFVTLLDSGTLVMEPLFELVLGRQRELVAAHE